MKSALIEKAIELMTGIGLSKDFVEESTRIATACLTFAEKNGITVNEEILFLGALMHDIGKAQDKGLKHAFLSGRMIREWGFQEEVAKIAENHICLTREDVERERLDIPKRDYIPSTNEERVLCLIDKTYDKKTKRLGSVEDYLRKRKEQYGESSEVYKSIFKTLRLVSKDLKLKFKTDT